MSTKFIKPYTGTLEPGFYYEDVPNSDYHSAEGISKSGLDLIHRSPAHFAFRGEKTTSRAMDIGTAIHTAILEPDRFSQEYMLLHGVTDRRKAEYKEAVKVYGAERTLTATEANKVMGMQESIGSIAMARRLLHDLPGHVELSGIVRDPVTGIICRHRFDRLVDGGLAIDIKKTQDASPEAFSRTIWKYRYHVQAAFYMDQHEWITGEKLSAFYFIAVEEECPNAAKMYQLDDDAIAIGREEYREDLNRYAECESSGEWPSYGEDPEFISLPGFVMAQYENELEDGGVI